MGKDRPGWGELLDRYSEIQGAWLRWRESHEPGLLIQGQEPEEITGALNALYEIETELRRLKLALSHYGRALAAGQRPTRATLLALRRDAARAGLLLADVDRLSGELRPHRERLEAASGSLTYLYTLADPDTGEVRYVGKSDQPARRLRQHLEHPSNPAMARWLGSLQTAGKAPQMEIIEAVASSDWPEREARQIWRYRAMGFDLLNEQGPQEP